MPGLVSFDAGVYSIDAVCFVLFFGRCGSLIAVARTSPLTLLLCSSVTMGALGYAKLPEQPFIHHLRLWLVVLLKRKKADQPDLEPTKSPPVPVDGTQNRKLAPYKSINMMLPPC